MHPGYEKGFPRIAVIGLESAVVLGWSSTAEMLIVNEKSSRSPSAGKGHQGEAANGGE